MTGGPVSGGFDERQRGAQQRTGQVAFFVTLGACLLNAAVMSHSPWGTPIQQAAAICFIGMCTWTIPVVWRGAYWHSPTGGWGRVATSGVVAIMWAFFTTTRGVVWQGSHAGPGFETFLLAVLCGVVTLLSLIRMALDRRAEEA